jgi:hypothetical protein
VIRNTQRCDPANSRLSIKSYFVQSSVSKASAVPRCPYFLTRGQYELLLDRSQILAEAFDKVAAAMLADPTFMDRVGIGERERPFIMAAR